MQNQCNIMLETLISSDLWAKGLADLTMWSAMNRHTELIPHGSDPRLLISEVHNAN